MRDQNEQVFSSIRKLKLSLQNLLLDYREFVRNIRDENIAIKKADLPELERIVSAKVLLSDKIESHVLDIMNFNIPVPNQPSQDSTKKKNPTLTAVLQMAQKALENGAVDERELRKCLEVMSNCERLVQEIVELRKTAELEVKVNRDVLERMLRIQQENYRFWQSVAAESESTYDAGGQKRGDARTSIVKVQI
jgi:hypothetical protein